MRLRTIWLISTLVLGLLAAPLPTEAQQTGKVYRIGYLTPWPLGRDGGSWPRIEAFLQGLRDLGYVEGRNITITYRSSDRRNDRLPELAEELVRQKVDVIVACCQPAVDAARKATRTIPIVVAVTGDFVGQGLVKSLRRPGGNVTGLSTMGPDRPGNSWSSSKRWFPGCLGWLSSGTRPIVTTPSVSSRRKKRPGRLAYGLSPSTCAAPPSSPGPFAGWQPRELMGLWSSGAGCYA